LAHYTRHLSHAAKNLIGELLKGNRNQIQISKKKSELVENVHLLIKNGTDVVSCLTQEVDVILQLFI
jgi:hypothetical protein